MTKQEEMFRRFDEKFKDTEVRMANEDNPSFYSTSGKELKSFIQSEIDLAVAERDNQVKSRIANIFASKYENEPRVSEKIEKAVINCFNDEDFELKSNLSLITKDK